MSKFVDVDATFSVVGGGAETVSVDVEGKTLEQVAYAVLENAEGISLCHQCDGQISDPFQEEVTGMFFDGQEYIPNGDGTWRGADDPVPAAAPEEQEGDRMFGFKKKEQPYQPGMNPMRAPSVTPEQRVTRSRKLRKSPGGGTKKASK